MNITSIIQVYGDRAVEGFVYECVIDGETVYVWPDESDETYQAVKEKIDEGEIKVTVSRRMVLQN